MNSRIFLNLLIIFCLSISLPGKILCAEKQPKADQQTFPDLSFQNILSSGDRMYLGISGKASFTFREITADLIIIDLTNTYCFKCKENIPVLNEVFREIENSSPLKGKVKIVSIAIGNTRNEIESYKREHKPLYPLIADPFFAVHKALGSPRVPYSLFIKSDASGNRIIWKTHQGIFEAASSLLCDINNFMSQKF